MTGSGGLTTCAKRCCDLALAGRCSLFTFSAGLERLEVVCLCWQSARSGVGVRLLLALLLLLLAIRHVDLDSFEDAIGMHSQSSFVAVGFDHQFQRVAEVFPALFQAAALGDCAGDLLDPAHKPPV